VARAPVRSSACRGTASQSAHADLARLLRPCGAAPIAGACMSRAPITTLLLTALARQLALPAAVHAAASVVPPEAKHLLACQADVGHAARRLLVRRDLAVVRCLDLALGCPGVLTGTATAANDACLGAAAAGCNAALARGGAAECDAGDDNSDVLPDHCRTDCTDPRCGDGVVDSDEECDDGNQTDGDGCAADCTAEPGVCGNRVVEDGEECDDGNQTDGDGC